MILDDITAAVRKRLAQDKRAAPPEEMREKALALTAGQAFPFERALAKEGISFICEVKKASPSKGLIARDFPYRTIARDYEQAGAEAGEQRLPAGAKTGGGGLQRSLQRRGLAVDAGPGGRAAET